MKGKGKEMESEEKGGDWRGKVVDWKKRRSGGGTQGQGDKRESGGNGIRGWGESVKIVIKLPTIC